VILATPVVEQLHYDFPDAKIDFLLKKGIEGVFESHPFLNQVIVWNKSKKKYDNYFRLLKQIRATRYDLIVNIQRFFTTGLLTALSGAKYKAGFNKNPFSVFFDARRKHVIGTKDNFMHETARNLSLISDFAGIERGKMKLYPTADDYRFASALSSEKYVCIGPASLWHTKQWPQEKWSELIEALDEQFAVFLIGSKSDYQICENLRNSSRRHHVVNLAGILNFLQSAALMKNAVMNFVNDSAPMHMASAVDAPVTAVYCSTLPSFGFGPKSTKSFIVEIEEELPCRPCGLHGRRSCPEKHFKCALNINIQQLIKTLE
jgi:heptosyltransferase II